MSRSGFVLVSKGLLLVLILAWMPAGARSSPADSEDLVEMERIKQRASEYFSAVGSRRFGKASQFILPRSRDTISTRQSHGSRITNFAIVGVKLEAGNRSAVVTIKQEAMAAGLLGRMEVKQKFRWKKEEGEWFLDPADPPKTDAEIFREYYYKKLGAAPTAEFEETVFDFGWIAQGDPVNPRFSFRNPSSQDIIVEKIYGPERLITDRTEKRLVPAGSAGEIIVDLKTAKLHRDFVQDIFVQFEPVKEMVKLRIKGKVYTSKEIAKSPSLSKEAAAGEVRRTGNP